MPIYQYHCDACDRGVELFFRSAARSQEPRCPECGGARLHRRVSRFAAGRSERARLDAIDVGQELGRLDGRGVGDFARWSRDLGDRLGDGVGAEFRELADRADAGDDPIERVDAAHTLRTRIDRAKQSLDSGGDA